jgi:hypothetical protein
LGIKWPESGGVPVEAQARKAPSGESASEDARCAVARTIEPSGRMAARL